MAGRSALGEMVNPDEQITRQEAVRLLTRGNAYQMNMEAEPGSIKRDKELGFGRAPGNCGRGEHMR